jgi:hypothetical protein
LNLFDRLTVQEAGSFLDGRLLLDTLSAFYPAGAFGRPGSPHPWFPNGWQLRASESFTTLPADFSAGQMVSLKNRGVKTIALSENPGCQTTHSRPDDDDRLHIFCSPFFIDSIPATQRYYLPTVYP